MKRSIYQTSAALLVLLASGCQTGLPTELIVDDTPPSIPDLHVPPLSGGTLLVTGDTSTAVVSDPERDRILIVDLSSGGVREVQLEPRDEPGRLVEGPTGTVFVALRGGGAVVAVELESATIAQRSAVCAGPRGMAYDGAGQRLLIACASGELVTVDPTTLVQADRVFLGADLRDVLLQGEDVFVTHFRSAVLTKIAEADDPEWVRAPDAATNDELEIVRAPHVAWRTSAAADGMIVMLHQMHRTTEIELSHSETGLDESGQSSYGGDCGEEPVQAQITLIWPNPTGYGMLPNTGHLAGMHLPVDMAVSPDGRNAVVVDPAAHQVVQVELTSDGLGGCFSEEKAPQPVGAFVGTPVAVAFAGDDIVLQSREPATLQVFREGSELRTIDLAGDSRDDTGFDLFHNTSALSNQTGMACASCHPEGRDDGHVWIFSGEGERRTQSLAGTLAGTAPFHWGGNLPTLRSVMDEVATRRMGGVKQSPARIAALESWLLSLEPLRVAPVPVVEQSQVEQGEALFQDEAVGCASCHSGPSFTNNRNEYVGRGDALQVPSLIGVGMRAPFMHDGCARTLLERFTTTCGGGVHGNLAGHDAADVEALVAYMNTL